VAKAIAECLSADIEEINTPDKRSGLFGYLKCGHEGMSKKMTEINQTKNEPIGYTLVIIGTPVWSFNISSPIRAYIEKHKGKMKNIGFFCTQGGSGHERAFQEMQKLCGQEPLAVLPLTTKEVVQGGCQQGVENFCNKITSSI